MFKHRPSGQGGVAIMVKNGVNFTQIPLNSSMEVIAVGVKSPFKMTIVSLYIPPNSPFDIEEFDTVISSLPKPLVISGDLNAHHHLWDPHRQNSRGREIANLIEKHELVILNDGQMIFIHSAMAH